MAIRTLLLTVLPESEDKTFRSVFGLENAKMIEDEKGYPVYESFLDGMEQNQIICSCIVKKGNVNAALATSYLLDKYKPKQAILVGTCAGRMDKTRVGDVVVSSMGVFDYGQSLLKKGEEIRLNAVSASDSLSRKIMSLKSSHDFMEKWKQLCLDHAGRLNVQGYTFQSELYGKAIASGSQIIDETTMNILTTANDNIYAGDQDSAGFASSCNDEKLDWIAVRGVSDFGDRQMRKDNAVAAMIAAASVVRLFLGREKDIMEDHKNSQNEVMDKMQSLLGCSGIWVPTGALKMQENMKRNQMKKKAIGNSDKFTLRLLAQTGYSFLCPRGEFYDDIENHLKRGGTFNILLTSKSTVNVIMSKKENREIKSKYDMAFNGYAVLKKKYEDQITVKTIDFNLPATIFIAAHQSFFEPYIHITEKREENIFVSFEMMFEKNEGVHGYNLMMEYFQQLYRKGNEFFVEEE